jgi:hypothetical protein
MSSLPIGPGTNTVPVNQLTAFTAPDRNTNGKSQRDLQANRFFFVARRLDRSWLGFGYQIAVVLLWREDLRSIVG